MLLMTNFMNMGHDQKNFGNCIMIMKALLNLLVLHFDILYCFERIFDLLI